MLPDEKEAAEDVYEAIKRLNYALDRAHKLCLKVEIDHKSILYGDGSEKSIYTASVYRKIT